MNEENLGDFATYSTTPVTALIMQRGVWNNATKTWIGQIPKCQ